MDMGESSTPASTALHGADGDVAVAQFEDLVEDGVHLGRGHLLFLADGRVVDLELLVLP